MRYLNNRGRNQGLFVTFHGTGGNLYSLYFLTEELDAKAGVLSFLGEVENFYVRGNGEGLGV